MRNAFAWFMLAALLSAAGCIPGREVKEVAAPPAPPVLLPYGLDRLPVPAAEGFTRVILDAKGQHATVTEVLDWRDSTATASGPATLWVNEHGERSRPICITPCEFDFSPGLHVLRFSVGPERAEEFPLQVGSKRKLFRVALGHDVPSSSPSAGMTGLMLQILGASAAIVGAGLWASSSMHDASAQKTAGIGLTLGGGAAFLLGIPLASEKPGIHQPSAVTEVTLGTTVEHSH